MGHLPFGSTGDSKVMENEVIEKTGTLVKLVDWMVKNGQQGVGEYVEKLKTLNPGISNDDLAKKIVSRKSVKNGLVGAATGVGGLITLPVSVPVDLAVSWKIQIFMAISIAHVYGHNSKSADIKTDVFLILAGDSAKEGLKRFGIEVSKGITKKAIDKYITKEVMVQIWKVIPKKIITKAGEKSVTSFMKMVPIVGAPIGYAFDWFAAQAVGKTAIKYYSGRG